MESLQDFIQSLTPWPTIPLVLYILAENNRGSFPTVKEIVTQEYASDATIKRTLSQMRVYSLIELYEDESDYRQKRVIISKEFYNLLKNKINVS